MVAVELGRRLFHILAYLTVFFIGWYVFESYGLMPLCYSLLGLLVLLLIGDYVTADLGIRLPVYAWFERPSELKRGFHSVTFGVLGALLAVRFFDIRIAAAAVLIMAISDPVGAIVGLHVRIAPFFRKKNLAGTFASLILNFVIASFIVNNIIVIAGMALAAALVGLFVNKIDDNLTVPLIAGLVGQLLIYLG